MGQQKVPYDAERSTHTAQGIAVTTVHGDPLWCDGGWPGSCHEHQLLALSGIDRVLDAAEVTTLVDRGFRGMARTSIGMPRPATGDRRPAHQGAAHRRPARLQPRPGRAAHPGRAADRHLANAWSLRRWRGLLYRVRQVFHAVAALVSLGRWLHRIPT